ncbi:MAG TPA: hypothetical protein PKW35_24310 [Nannocystaceae bacterium]|nr:hypothetical protein [Nannocystaceae bacterium]
MVDITWSHPDGRIALWHLDDAGGVVVKEHKTAPGMALVNVTEGAALWRYPDGGIKLWHLDGDGNRLLYFEKKKGPYDGWRAVNCTRTGGDALTWLGSLLWHHTDGRISLWKIDANLDVDRLGYKESGPYQGWTPIQLEGDNLLWQRGDGRISYWRLTPEGTNGGYTEHGPHDGWSAIGCTRIAGTSERRILWRHRDGGVSYWAVTRDGEMAKNSLHPAGYAEYAPGGNWRAIGCGHDRILWHDPVGRRISVWRMGQDLRMIDSRIYPAHTSPRAADLAPDRDWQPVSIGV